MKNGNFLKMENKEKLGQEPAFPLLNVTDGINKRFYAACAAMQGMLAHSTRYKPYKEDEHLHWHTALTKEAFHIADELLKRENEEKRNITAL